MPLFFIAALLVPSLVLAISQPSHPGDFLQYWSAWRLMTSGANPYNAEAMLLVQKSVFPLIAEPVMLWAPPWVPILMLPALLFSYAWAQLLWCCIGLGSAICAVRIWFGSLSLRSILLALFFCPLYYAIAHGQSVLLLPLGIVLFLRGHFLRAPVLIGLGTILMTVKPHIFVVFAAAFVFQSFYHSHYRQTCLSAASALILLGIATYLTMPQLLSDWIYALKNPSLEATSVLEWRGTTLVPWLRHFSFENFGLRADWLMALVPGFGVLALAWMVFYKKFTIDTPDSLAVLLAISYCLAPYGWNYDQTILMPLYLLSITPLLAAGPSKPQAAAWWAVALQIAMIVASATIINYGHQFWVLPLAMLALQLLILSLSDVAERGTSEDVK